MGRQKKASKNVKTATRARDLGTVRLVSAEIDPRMDDAIESLMRQTMHKKRVIIVKALEEYLEKAGLWPPDATSGHSP